MRPTPSTQGSEENTGERGTALVEFAMVLPVLLILVFGIIDFGLYLYNDLRLTHAARDAARYASVNDAAGADAAIDSAALVSTTLNSRSVDLGSSGHEATVSLEATYRTLTPLPGLVGIGNTLAIHATAVMRRE
ncbi:MAG: TadE family protein [Thermoleophilia bacterium]